MGVRSTKPEDCMKPMELTTVLSIASCTKLMTAIAVLQCVEKGKLKLDDDVYEILPELESLEILTGIDQANGKPLLKPRSSNITLR